MVLAVPVRATPRIIHTAPDFLTPHRFWITIFTRKCCYYFLFVNIALWRNFILSLTELHAALKCAQYHLLRNLKKGLNYLIIRHWSWNFIQNHVTPSHDGHFDMHIGGLTHTVFAWNAVAFSATYIYIFRDFYLSRMFIFW